MPNVPASESLVTWAEQPLLQLRRIVLAFLQGLFEQADSGCFQWSEQLEDTEIIITDESPIKTDVVGKRPAISVVRGTLGWGQTSLDEMRDTDFKTGARTHTDMLSGTLIINCCSRADLESEYIAWIVAQHLWAYRRLLMRGTPIHSLGRGLTLGPISPAGSLVQGSTEGEWLNTYVSMPIFFQNNFTLTPLNQTVVRRVEAVVHVNPAQVSAVIRPPRIRGKVLPSITQTIVEKE